MTGPVLTQHLAWCAAEDVGNRSMRRGGRASWSVDDYNAAVREYNRLWFPDAEPTP
ncbi:hypothetical protein LCGC14_2960410 [marine sediment metagenome]|uniref:Uncharacterized protein n=1 Tax=marine sediment metagenome TaxID=412755 RepID=A0A0F8XD88_9ZZZZ